MLLLSGGRERRRERWKEGEREGGKEGRKNEVDGKSTQLKRISYSHVSPPCTSAVSEC